MDVDDVTYIDDDIVPDLPQPDRTRLRIVYGLLQVLGCVSMVVAGFTVSLTVGLVVLGLGMLAVGIGLERSTWR